MVMEGVMASWPKKYIYRSLSSDQCTGHAEKHVLLTDDVC